MLESSREQPEKARSTRFRWRWWMTLGLLILLLATLALLPGVPVVREWLLGYARTYVEKAGYTLDYQNSSGNLWQGFKLENVHLQGQGQDVALKSLELDYFLPSLITGKLPLSIAAQGLSGDINFKTLGVGTSVTPNNENVLPIKIELKNVDLNEIALQARDVPFTLPNFSLDNLKLESRGELLHFNTTVGTVEGSADVEGDVNLSPFSLEADVKRADVNLARQWWDGIEAGTTTGHVSVQDGQVRAQAKISDGQIRFMNETVTGIEGEANLEFPKVRAVLTGQTLGGSIQATGGVDIDQENWFADIDGDVDLKRAAVWLAMGRLPFPLDTWPLEGQAQAKVKASGWLDVNIEGQTIAEGTLATLPLKIQDSNFTVSKEGVIVNANGTLANGPLTASFKPEDQGIVFELGVNQAQVLPFAKADGNLVIRSQPTGTTGQSNIDLAGRLWGRDFNLNAEGVIEDGWQNFITGQTSLGEIIDGAVVLNSDLEGQVNIQQVQIPGASELLELNLAVTGPPTSLPLTLTVTNPERFDYDIAGVIFPIQGGQITGLLEIPDIKNIQGSFGPINLQGGLSLNDQDVDFSFNADDVPLSGRLETMLDIPSGRFVLQEGKVSSKFEVQTTDVKTAGVIVAPIAGKVTIDLNDGLKATLTSPTLDLTFQNGNVNAELKNTETIIANQDLVLNGSAQLRPEDLSTLSADITANSDLANITLKGQNGQLEFKAKREDKYPFDVSGTVNVLQNSVDFSGILMDAKVSGTGSWQEALNADILIQQGDEAVTVTITGKPQDPEINAKGTLPADALEPILNIPLNGSVQLDIIRREGEFSGSAKLEGTVNDIPVDVDLIGQGESITLEGTATPFGQELDVSGAIDLFAGQPKIDIKAEGDIGTFEFTRTENGFNLQGQGVTPDLSTGGFNLSGQPWELSGPIDDLSLSVGGSNISITQAGGLSASGKISQPFIFQGLELLLEADTTITSDSSSVNGTLTVTTPTQQAVFPVSGSLDALNIGGVISAQELVNVAKLPVQVAGDIQVDGTLSLLGESPTYEFKGKWLAGEVSVPFTVLGQGSAFEVIAQSDNLTAKYSPQGLEFSATSFDPKPFLVNPNLSGLATGQMNWNNGQWSGEMQYESQIPVVASLTLNGEGETLGVTANYSNKGVVLSASGQAYPELSLNVEGYYNDLVTLNGQLNGTPAQPDFEGTLTTKEFVQSALDLFIPAQKFAVHSEGFKAILSSEDSSLNLDQSGLSGNIRLPLMLKGEPHTLDVTASGSFDTISASAQMAGNVLQGSLSFAENILTADVFFNPDPYLQMISVINSEPLHIVLQSDTALNWKADISGQGQLDKLPAELSATVTGQGASYQADAGLRMNGQIIPLQVIGQGGDIQAKADFDYFPLSVLEPYVQSQGELRGYVRYDSVQEQPLDINLNAEGQLANQPFALNAVLNANQPLRINITQGNTSLLIEPKNARQYDFALALPEFQYPFLLQGNVDVADSIRVSATGQLGQEPLSLQVSFNPATVEGNYLIQMNDSSLQGTLSNVDDVLTLQSRLELKPNNIITTPISASLQASSVKGQWNIEDFKAMSSSISAQVSGQVFPNTDLTGLLNLASLAPIDFHLQRGEGYHLEVSQGDLKLSSLWSSLTRLESAHLQGTGLVADMANVDSNLSWQRGSGFTGNLDLETTLPNQPLMFTLNALGQGNLELSGKGSLQDMQVATLGLTVSPNAESVIGRLGIEGDITQLYNLGSPLVVSSDVDVSGSLLKLGVIGPVSLSGVINAQGQVTSANVYREGRLELNGDINAVASYGANGYSVQVDTQQLNISSLLPQLNQPVLTSKLLINKINNEPIIQSDIDLALENSHVTGKIAFDQGWRGNLNIDGDLADIQSLPLQGLLKGEIKVDDVLDGNLQVSGFNWGEDNAYADGVIDIAGSITSPNIAAKLTGTANASGEVSLNFQNQTLNLRSTLASTKFSSDVALTYSSGSATGGGFINVLDYQLRVGSSETGLLNLIGEEKLQGWQGYFDALQNRLDISGNLTGLNQTFQGQVQVTLSPAGVSGNLTDVSVGNLVLGDAVLNSNPEGILVKGENIEAIVDTANQSWTIQHFHLPASTTSLDVKGSGSFSSAKLEGFVQTTVLGQAVQMPINLDYADQILNLKSQGELPEGYIEILAQATPQTGWQGSVKLRTLIKNVQADIQGEIDGEFLSPRVSISNLITRDGIQLSGQVQAGLNEIGLEQTLVSDQLDYPLMINGNLNPLDLTLSSNNETLHIVQQDKLIAEGNISINWNNFELDLVGNQGLEFGLDFPLTGLSLVTTLNDVSISGLQQALQEGVLWQGRRNTKGSLLLGLQQGLFAQFEDLRYQSPLGTLSLGGGIRQEGGWRGQIIGTWQGTGQDSDWLPWLSSLNRADINVLLEEKDAALIIQSDAGSVNATFNRETTEALLRADLALGSGQLKAYVTYNDLGPAGEITITEVPMYKDLNLDSNLTIDPTSIGGRATVGIGEGQLSLEGSLGLASFIPVIFVPQGSQSQQISLRMDNVNVQKLPYVQRRLPYLDATLSAFARLQDQRWVGQMSSNDLMISEKSLPLSIEFNGPLSALELRGTLARSTFNAVVDPSHAEGLLSFEQFPLESLVEAAVGETGAEGVLWGAMRFDIPWNHPTQGYLRFASESIVLGQDDTETKGQLSFRIENGGLVIDEAAFEGDGRWQAAGQLTPEVMDFKISARDANFTPILLLFPQLAALGFGASGSFEFSAKGSFASPQATLISPGLDISISGSSYRLQETLISLRQGQLNAQSQLLGLKPIGGNLTLISQGTVQLNPARANLIFRTSGSANIPALGEVEDIDATISSTADTPVYLDLTGRLGQAFEIQGSLAPLDIRLQGQDLNLQAKERFLDSSQADVDMRLRYEQGLILSGSILADVVNIKLGGQENQDTTETTEETLATSPNRYLEKVFFDSIEIKAPQQINFNENFGKGDLRADVVLTGTAANPELSGEAQSIRGDLNFGGRTFRIDRAVAEFQPSRGIYPNLSISATASLEKITALRGNSEITFVEPSGPTFEVFLTFSGELLPKEGGGFSADLNPSLSSNAVISTSAGQRTLTENELFSLITLRNLQLAETITGEGSVTESVAQGALDTAVDYFILSELQTQLGEALGLDLFEVRTTALSSILAGSESFGVALRIGGYLRDDLFASYEIRTLDLDPDVAFSNEFSLRYDFSPLELDLTGRLNILRQASFTPAPELSISLGYAVSPLLRVQGGLDISQQEQSVRFGISLRW